MNGLPKPVLAFLWLMVAIGGIEVAVVLVGSIVTRNASLLPALVVGLGDVSISALLLWALRRIAP